jgi:hypothetical protein
MNTISQYIDMRSVYGQSISSAAAHAVEYTFCSTTPSSFLPSNEWTILWTTPLATLSRECEDTNAQQQWTERLLSDAHVVSRRVR